MTTVQEPDPNLGTVTTSYTYDVFNRLITVSMPRGSTTQTRTFTYTGVNLTAVTNPENGTVNNYYNTDNTLNYKVDAKGQAIVYSYDSYKRVTQISKYPSGYTPGGSNSEDVCQRVSYYYDSNPDTTNYNYTQYLAGRLTSVHYAGSMCQTFNGQTQSATTGNNYIELYGYTQAGQVTRKTLRLQKQVNGPQNPVTVSADLEAAYTYDSEGKMLTQSYPLGTTYQYTYDTLGRPIKMTDTVANQDLVGSVTYGPAGELISMSGTSVGETRSYNVNGQLTQINGTGMNIQYNYPAAGSNNGQISSQYDVITGETISYTYDSLKRLASATAVQGGGQTWNQNFAYDGFGNLTAKTGSGIAPVGSYPTDANTNHLTGVSYDNNGNQLYANGSNLGYDVSNRMINSTGGSLAGLYEYDPKNQRVYQQRQSWNGSSWTATATEFYFYSIGGRKLGTYTTSVSGSGSGTTMIWTLQTTQVFFRGKLIQRGGATRQEDIRGSVGRFYPYGEDRDNSANDTIKFATYTRDSVSGLDYGVNRYYLAGNARFSGPDPAWRSAQASVPKTWNRYSYVGGDPLSRTDTNGLFINDEFCLIDDAGEDWCYDIGPMDPDDPWYVAEEHAEFAAAILSGAHFSANCGDFLLQTLGIEISAVQGRAASASLENGTTSTEPIGVAIFPNDPALAAQQQAKADAQSGHSGTTVGQWFAMNPNIHAFAQYGGNEIFYNGNYFENAGPGMLLYLEFHEVLHLLGLSDAYIQQAFGLSYGPGVASDNITIKLLQECGH